MDEFLQHELLLAAGAREDLTPSPAEVEQELSDEIARRIKNAHLGDHTAWETELARLGLDEERWRSEQRFKSLNTFLIDRMVRARRKVTEEEVIAAWEERFGPGGVQTTVRWIQVRIDPPTPPPGITREEERALREAAREVARERAEEVRSAWRAGAEFSALQRSSGNGEEPADPFHLDEFVWPETVRREIAALPPGEVSVPLSAKGGWSVLQPMEKSHTPLEEVREEVTGALAARSANSAETSALIAELIAEVAPKVALPDAAFVGDPRSSELEVGHIYGRPVQLSSFASWLTQTRGRPHLEPFFQTQLVRRLSEALGATFTAEEVALRMDSDLEDRLHLFYDGDRTRWLAELRSDGRTLAGWRREAAVRAQHDLRAEALLLARRVVDVREVHAEWERRHGPEGLARTVRWILLSPSTPPADLGVDELGGWLERELDALAIRAGELRERIVEGGEDFATLARRNSTDVDTRAEGGLLPGVFDPRVQATLIAEAVSPLQSGAVSQPVRLSRGCALYQVLKIEHTPFEEVKGELHALLMKKRPSAVELVSFVNQLYEESQR